MGLTSEYIGGGIWRDEPDGYNLKENTENTSVVAYGMMKPT
jgi:hypothetical protein